LASALGLTLTKLTNKKLNVPWNISITFVFLDLIKFLDFSRAFFTTQILPFYFIPKWSKCQYYHYPLWLFNGRWNPVSITNHKMSYLGLTPKRLNRTRNATGDEGWIRKLKKKQEKNKLKWHSSDKPPQKAAPPVDCRPTYSQI